MVRKHHRTIFETEINQFSFCVLLVKGITWPFDIQASMSYNELNRLVKFSGVGQMSIFQRPFWPSVAVNGGHSRLLQNHNFEAENYSLALSTSWGYRSFLVFGNLSQNITATHIKNEDKSSIKNSLTNQYGLQYRLSPLSKISISRNLESGSIVSNEIKLSLGI